MNRQLLLLDQAINSLNSEYQSSTLRLIKSLPAETVELGVPALFSVLLRLLLKHKLSKKDKNEIMSFLSYCICDICSSKFLLNQSENIDKLYGRLLQEQLLFNTFEVCCRMITLRCPHYSHVLLMFFVYHADSFDLNERTKNQIKTLSYLNARFDAEAIGNRWRSEILTAESCLSDFVSPFEYSQIKPSGILLYSPLLNDLSFCEHFLDDMEMLEFLARHAVSSDVLTAILKHFASSFLYVSSKDFGVYRTKFLHLNNDMAEKIVDMIYSRGIVDVSVFVELNLFTEKLLRDEEYSQLVINKLLNLSRYYQSVDCLMFLVDNYLDLLEPHLRVIKDLIDAFLSEKPDDCRNILSKLIRRFDARIDPRLAKCSQAVRDYIQTFRISSEASDSDKANKKLEIMKDIKRLHSYVNARNVKDIKLLR